MRTDDDNPTWDVDPTTRTVLRHIASLGYRVDVEQDRDSGDVVMRATKSAPPEDHRARIGGSEPGDVAYRCACVLAEMVGIDLEG